MEPIRSGTSSGSDPEAVPGASSASPGASTFPVVDSVLEREQIERTILLGAIARDGPSFSRAWLMVWNPRADRLEGWAYAGAPGAAATDGPADSTAARPDPEAVGAWRAYSVVPSRLAGAAGDAWRLGAECIGAGGGGSLPWSASTRVGATALRRGTGLLGLLVGEWDAPGDDETRRAALEALRGATSTALAQFDRSEEARRRAQRAGALAELARASVSSLNLAEALHLAARLAVEATSSRGSALWVSQRSGPLRLEVTYGPSGARERLGRALQPLAESVREENRPRLPERVTRELLIGPEVAAELSSLAMLPLSAYGRVLGVLAVYDRAAPHPSDRPEYDALDVEYLVSLAALAALMVDQAGRFEALRLSELRCDELRARVRREERLASVGALAARAAEEARNPLASIGAFARRVYRELPEDHPHRECLEIVIRESERLERIVGEPARHAPPEPARLSVESLNAILQDVLRGAGETLVRRRVRLLKKLSPDLPPLLLDAGRVRHVVTNLLEGALAAVPVGGRVRIESRCVHPYVVVDVAHDGPSQPGDALEQLFIPFASRTGAGASLGLATAQRLVREHGGEIRVRNDPEWPSLISLTFPIHDNRDRRAHRAERRAARDDRRQRFPEA